MVKGRNGRYAGSAFLVHRRWCMGGRAAGRLHRYRFRRKYF